MRRLRQAATRRQLLKAVVWEQPPTVVAEAAVQWLVVRHELLENACQSTLSARGHQRTHACCRSPWSTHQMGTRKAAPPYACEHAVAAAQHF